MFNQVIKHFYKKNNKKSLKIYFKLIHWTRVRVGYRIHMLQYFQLSLL